MDEEKYEGIKAELRTRFELLPEELQNVIRSSEYQTKLFEVAKKNKWTYEQLGILELETTMVLLGMTNPNEYQNELAREVGKKPVEITSVVNDMKTQVFDPIRSSLMRLYTEKKEDDEDTTTSLAAEKAQTSTDTDSKVLERSGITIEQQTPVTDSPSTEKRDAILSGIENPPKSTSRILNEISGNSSVPKAPYAPKSSSGIVGEKLSSTVAIPPKATDYSLPKKTAPTPPVSSGTDPYKEPIE